MKVFVVATGQEDNIGDVVLRRRMLERVAKEHSCVVYVGRASPGFVDGLALSAEHRVESSFARWLLSLYAATLREEVVLLHKPGELTLTVRSAAQQSALGLAAALMRLRGHHVARLGVGIRELSPFARVMVRTFLTLDSVTVWRDVLSQKVLGCGHQRLDWAFGEASFAEPSRAVRDTLAISMRYDRGSPSQAWFDAMESVASQRGLRIVTVTQVRRDNAVNDTIARRFRCEHIEWTDMSHLTQEQRVRQTFSRSEVVVSDRLHALVLGLRDGAVPVGAINGPDIKVGRHFEAAGIDHISFDTTSLSAAEIARRIHVIVDRSSEIFAAAQQAADAVSAMDELLTPPQSLIA